LLTRAGVCEEADQQRDIVHGVQVGPDVFNATGQLGPIAHVVLKSETTIKKKELFHSPASVVDLDAVGSVSFFQIRTCIKSLPIQIRHV
jgi:hypothetical protein